MAPKVLITFAPMVRNAGTPFDLLRDAGCDVLTSNSDRWLTADELIPLVHDVDAIIAGGDPIDANVIAAAPRLKVVSRHGVGYDAVDVVAATRAGVVVTITPGSNSVSVAELTFGFLVALARRIPQMSRALHEGDWTRRPGMELAGKTLGLVGLGNIGKAVATRALAFGLRVIATDVVRDERFAAENDIAYVPLSDLLREADFVSLHAPGLPGAAPLIGEPELRTMKRGSHLINTARGSLVDEDALYRALVDGHLAGAALDVFAQEPPGPSPLLTLDSVLATPHIGGTIEAGTRTALMATENALQVLRGEHCPHAVNPEVYAQSSSNTLRPAPRPPNDGHP